MKTEVINRSPFPALMTSKEQRIVLTKSEVATLVKALAIVEELQERYFKLKDIDPDYDNDYMDEETPGAMMWARIGLEKIVSLGDKIVTKFIDY